MKRAAGPGRPGGFEESSNRAALLAFAVGSMLALALRILLSRVLFALILLVRSMHGRALVLVVTLLAGILWILLPEVLLSGALLIKLLLIALLWVGILLISVGHDGGGAGPGAAGGAGGGGGAAGGAPAGRM